MHICFLNFIIEYYTPRSGGAVATVIMEMSRELIGRGHRVTVMTPMNGDTPYAVGRVVPLETRDRRSLSFIQRRVSDLNRAIHKWDWHFYEYYINSAVRELKRMDPAPDVVVAQNDLVAPSYIKRALPGTRVVVQLHNEMQTNRPEPLRQRAIGDTDRFAVVSRCTADWTIDHHGIPADKVVIVNNGIDTQRFYPRPDFTEPRDRLKVLFIGRIDPNKGPHITARAIERLRCDEGLPIDLTVAGALWFYGDDDPHANPFFCELQEQIERVEGRYLGYVSRDDVPTLIREHDVVSVLSLSREPYGLVVTEAMASGCAVIGSNRGGIPEACGDAGMLVDPDDFDGVADAIRRLATDPHALRSAKLKSIERARQCTWANRVDRFEEACLSKA